MRLIWADIIKIIAILGVILLHVSAPYLTPFDASSREWWIGNIYDAFSRWCVPLFVMVSGSLLLPSAGGLPLGRFLRVRVSRVVIPFLTWSAIYFLYRIHVNGEALPLTSFFTMLLTEPVYYHLWFIYMLIVLYLFAPAISIFLETASKNHAWYFIVLWFFWTSLLPIFEIPVDSGIYYTPDMSDYSALRLSGYFLLGYMLKDRQAESARGLWGLFLAFLLGGAGTALGTYFMGGATGRFHPFFYHYYSITVVVMTVSLFLLIKSLFHFSGAAEAEDGQTGRFNLSWLFRKVGMGVFGVYLVHALVLDILRDGLIGFTIDHTSAFGMQMPLAIGIPVFAGSIFLISLFLILMVRAVPGARNVLA